MADAPGAKLTHDECVLQAGQAVPRALWIGSDSVRMTNPQRTPRRRAYPQAAAWM